MQGVHGKCGLYTIVRYVGNWGRCVGIWGRGRQVWAGGDGSAFVSGNKLDRPGYFSEYFHKYVRFVRSKACSGGKLGPVRAFLSIFCTGLGSAMPPRQSFLLRVCGSVVLANYWGSPARQTRRGRCCDWRDGGGQSGRDRVWQPIPLSVRRSCPFSRSRKVTVQETVRRLIRRFTWQRQGENSGRHWRDGAPE